MNANCIFANYASMSEELSDREIIEQLVAFAGVSATAVARNAKVAVTTLTRPLNKDVDYKVSKATFDKLRAAYPGFPGWGVAPQGVHGVMQRDYVEIDILPTYAGMGGGGTGDGDRETALIPSALIHHELRGQPKDFLLINVRGDSMEPDFRHGDQLLVDTRDKSPAQPGPFAVWDGEWGEYVVKNVERLNEGRVRMFSSNAKYSATEIQHEETRIIGRPVWFGRRL